MSFMVKHLFASNFFVNLNYLSEKLSRFVGCRLLSLGLKHILFDKEFQILKMIFILKNID